MAEREVRVEGLRELHDALLELGAVAGARVMRAALRDAAKPLLDAMKNTVPVGTETRKIKTTTGATIEITPGFLKSRIKIKTQLNASGRSRRFQGDGIAKVRVGVFRVPYVAVIEYGASDRGIPPRPFIRPAFMATDDEVLARFSRSLAAKIEAARRRAAGR